MRRLHAHRACATAAAVLWLAVGAARADAYGIRVRWLHETSGGVTAYRVHIWPDIGPADPPHDVGSPSEDPDGTLSAVVTDLKPNTDYSIAVSAELSDGSETALSNVLRVAYADVAPFIDSDGDGLMDASDACPDTPAGAIVGPTGCSCEQLFCDDGDPCNGAETCTDGVCASAITGAGAGSDLTIHRFVLRSIRRGRSWRLDAVATASADSPELVPTNAIVEVWGSDAPIHFFASVRADRFAPRRNRLRFFAETEGAVGGLRRLEISQRRGLRTVWVQAVLPLVALPGGAGAPITWLVRLGETCARALDVTCTPAGRRFRCD